MAKRVGVLILALGAMATTSQIVLAETAGEQFRERIQKLERDCREHPPIKGSTRCDLFKVKIEDPMSTPEGRFAHSIKVPNAMPEDAGYRPEMSAVEYFRHLCKTYAGEFIFKTADKVEGIRELRPRNLADDYIYQHLFAMEDPYGHFEEEVEEPGLHFLSSDGYTYLERPISSHVRPAWKKRFFDPSLFVTPPENAKSEHYFRSDGAEGRRSLKLQYLREPQARYGFTWRGLSRPSDRELGIAGGELIVLDTVSSEVLGVRRGFAFWRGSWASAPLCPRYGYYGGFDKATAFTAWFTNKVARPVGWQQFFEKLATTVRLRERGVLTK